MENFIQFAAARFGLSPADAHTLAGALLWVIQLHAGDAFSAVHALDPEVRRLVDRAPAALAEARRPLPFFPGPGRVCGTQASLLRLFAGMGFSLARTGRFAQTLQTWLIAELGAPTVRAMVDHTPVLQLLAAAQDRPVPTPRVSRPLSLVA